MRVTAWTKTWAQGQEALAVTVADQAWVRERLSRWARAAGIVETLDRLEVRAYLDERRSIAEELGYARPVRAARGFFGALFGSAR